MQTADSQLQEKVAVITGGSGAIGGAIMRALEDAGARAISLDITSPKGQVEYIKCDVADDTSVQSAVREAYGRGGRLDIAIHAAGISRDAVTWKLTPADWDQILAINLRGAYSLCRHAIPLMRGGGIGGRIIFIGSINGSRGKFGTAAYSASKAGLVGLAKTIARETGRFGVLVNVIEPGWVRTPLTEVVPKAVQDAALAESLVGEFLSPDDVANAVLYLCGPGGAKITGQILRVDGGQFLGPT
jgi:NAD(P)-dependent dehydrogenase (short-subunit alcohol dehydrogenase family)